MSNTKTENETTPPADTAETQTVQVLTRFTRDELDAMKVETGANAGATAVACYVRKNLRKES